MKDLNENNLRQWHNVSFRDKKNFDFYDILKDDKKAIRFLDDLGFIKEFDCQNKPDCNAYEAIIIDYK